MTVIELQDLVAKLYGDRNARRGVEGNIESLSSRVQRLPGSLDEAGVEQQAKVLADIMVDVFSLAVGLSVNLEEATRFYIHGCPECGNNPCDCN